MAERYMRYAENCDAGVEKTIFTAPSSDDDPAAAAEEEQEGRNEKEMIPLVPHSHSHRQ